MAVLRNKILGAGDLEYSLEFNFILFPVPPGMYFI
jgi:hypothetical protein